LGAGLRWFSLSPLGERVGVRGRALRAVPQLVERPEPAPPSFCFQRRDRDKP